MGLCPLTLTNLSDCTFSLSHHPEHECYFVQGKTQQISINSDSVLKVARDISGLPGWTHPVTRLNWKAPHLSDDELDVALDRLSPRPPKNYEEPPNDTSDGDEAFTAWGLVWE